jgi:hypothetical protein
MSKLFFLLPAFILLLTSCGLDTQVRSIAAAKTESPAVEELRCLHPDADKDHPICDKYINACIFYACNIPTDKNYTQFTEYSTYISGLKLDQQKVSTIFHDASKCASAPAQIKTLRFTVQPSAAVYKNESLPVQPAVGFFDNTNKAVLKSLPLSFTVHTDSTCQNSSQVAATNWFMSSSNPGLTNKATGEYIFSGLKFLAEGTYYIKAVHPSFSPACSSAVVVSKDTSLAESLSITQMPDLYQAIHKNFTSQIKVSVLDATGKVVISDQARPIGLELYTDSSCSTSPVPGFTTDNTTKSNITKPSVDGVSTFSEAQSAMGGVFYVKAVSTGLKSDCKGIVKVAGEWKFKDKPLPSVKEGTPLADFSFGAYLPSGELAPLKDLPALLGVFTNATCTAPASSGSDYTLPALAKPTESTGVATYSGLTFLKPGTYYLAAKESLLKGSVECLPVTVGASANGVLLNPNPLVGEKNTPFSSGPTVVLVKNGTPVPDAGKPVVLKLYSDSSCNNPSSTTFTYDSPATLDANGSIAFKQFLIKDGGVYYVKASIDSLESACTQVLVAGELSFSQFNPVRKAGKPLSAAEYDQVGVYAQTSPTKILVPSYPLDIKYSPYTNSTCSTALDPTDWSAKSSTVKSSAGFSTFEEVIFKTPGTYYVKASTASGLVSECKKVDVEPVASSLEFVGLSASQGVTWVITRPLSPPVQVQYFDALKNPVDPSLGVSLTLHTDSSCSSQALSQGSGSYDVWNYKSSSSNKGLTTFSDTVFHQGGKFYLKATSSDKNITPACFGVFHIADDLVLKEDAKPTAVVGEKLANISVQAILKKPNTLVPLNLEDVTFTVKEGSCSGAVSTSYKATSVNPLKTQSGVATLVGLSFTKTGVYCVEFNHKELGLVQTCLITVKSAAASISIDKYPPHLLPKDPAKDPVVITLKDAQGTTLTGSDQDIKLDLSKDSSCSTPLLNYSTEWSIAGGQVQKTTNGVLTLNGLTVNAPGEYYLKATTDQGLTSCKGPILVAGGLKQVLPSSVLLNEIIKSPKPLTSSITLNGTLIPLDNKLMTFAVYKDKDCKVLAQTSSYSSSNLVNVPSVQGVSSVTSLSFNTLGIYYIKSTLSPELTSTCDPVEVKQPIINGCMQEDADNFNPSANTDDCSCSFTACSDKSKQQYFHAENQSKLSSYNYYASQCKLKSKTTTLTNLCSDIKICLSPQATNYTGSVVPLPGACANLSALTTLNCKDPTSSLCAQYKAYSLYCQVKEGGALSNGHGCFYFNTIPSIKNTATVPLCFSDPFRKICAHDHEQVSAKFAFCSRFENSKSSDCLSFFSLGNTCNTIQGQSSPACTSIIKFSSANLSCYVSDWGLNKRVCEHVQEFYDKVSKSSTPSGAAKVYSSYLNYCAQTTSCDKDKLEDLYSDLDSIQAPTSSNVCEHYSYLHAACAQMKNSYHTVCKNFYSFLEEPTSVNKPYLSLPSYNAYKTCNQNTTCTKSSTPAQWCEFTACDDPSREGYDKYVEFTNILKGISGKIIPDKSLCGNLILKPTTLKIDPQNYVFDLKTDTWGGYGIAPVVSAGVYDQTGTAMKSPQFDIKIVGYTNAQCTNLAYTSNYPVANGQGYTEKINTLTGKSSWTVFKVYPAQGSAVAYMQAETVTSNGKLVSSCVPVNMQQSATPTPTPAGQLCSTVRNLGELYSPSTRRALTWLNKSWSKNSSTLFCEKQAIRGNTNFTLDSTYNSCTSNSYVENFTTAKIDCLTVDCRLSQKSDPSDLYYTERMNTYSYDHDIVGKTYRLKLSTLTSGNKNFSTQRRSKVQITLTKQTIAFPPTETTKEVVCELSDANQYYNTTPATENLALYNYGCVGTVSTSGWYEPSFVNKATTQYLEVKITPQGEAVCSAISSTGGVLSTITYPLQAKSSELYRMNILFDVEEKDKWSIENLTN